MSPTLYRGLVFVPSVPSGRRSAAAAVLGYVVLYAGGRHGYPVWPAIDFMPTPIFELENGTRRVVMTIVPLVVGVAVAAIAGPRRPRVRVGLAGVAALAFWIGIASAARAALIGDTTWAAVTCAGACLVLAWAMELRRQPERSIFGSAAVHETEPAVAEPETANPQQRVVAAVWAVVLLVASVFLGGLAVFGVAAVREFEFDPARDRDPYLYAAMNIMAAVSAALFAVALAWRAATRKPIRAGRLFLAAAIVTALVLYVAAHNPAPWDFEMS